MQIFQIALALSILIVIHELGHFTFARLFGIRIDKFFLFFDAGGVKLFSTRSKWFLKLFPKAENWQTEYGIGWLPLGGYCKVNGMIDESMDTEHLKQEPKPWEFRSKPAWQRLFVMAGGVIFNFILGIMLYSFILCKWGEAYISADNCIYVEEGTLADEMGFKTGDRILALDGEAPENFQMMQLDMARDMVSCVTVERGNDTVDLYINEKYISDLLSTQLFEPAVPFVILGFSENSINKDSGLVAGDIITAIDSTEIAYYQDALPLLEGKVGQQITVRVLRGDEEFTLPMAIDANGMMGVYRMSYQIESNTYSFLESIPAGCVKAYEAIVGQIKDMRLVANPSTGAYKEVRSVIGMTEIMPEQWNWAAFINILAMISIILGVMNLLPIPALDGGHMVFTLYEMITRRKPSDNFMYAMQLIGMIIVFGLMFLACGNDISRLLK